MSKSIILSRLEGKNILILGYGREGKSTYHFIKQHLPEVKVTIADANPLLDITEIKKNKDAYILGENYLHTISTYDLIIKSPGISLKNHLTSIQRDNLSSQTDLFLQAYANQCIGVSGTKGKSTTASLIYHILQSSDIASLLAGNIGTPLFDIIPLINEHVKIVMELSSHQLEFIQKAPATAVLLNVFEEHLDHYLSFEAYQQAKYAIARYQQKNDTFIYNTDDRLIEKLLQLSLPQSQLLGFSYAPSTSSACYIRNHSMMYKHNDKEEKIMEIVTNDFPLKGKHNLANSCAALLAVLPLIPIEKRKDLKNAVYSFQSLPHRLEFVATIDDISYYNDSISTIPQATIVALEAIDNVNTLILGGMDRGIDYTPMKSIFFDSQVENFIFTGKAGERMMQLCQAVSHKKTFFSNDYTEIIAIAKNVTRKHHVCLLSPAASSFDAFTNFEHRGNVYKELIKNT
jgi:UDP-N-acetylmuramoylalanine--D-glutamate ligase